MSLMCEEIRQQPNALERTLLEEWPRTEQLRRYCQDHPVSLIILVARGTSDNAAQFGRYLLEICTGVPVSLAAPSVYTLYHSSVQLRNVAVVAISQSGESTDTNMVLEQARAAGAFTVGITNEEGSTLARLAHHTLLVRAGKEQSVAATKTYTGQLLCFYLLAHALGASIVRDDLEQISGWAAAALETETEIARRAERYAFMQHAVCIGRGLNYANSFEFALKLMETCYVVAERFSSADLLHGPIAMLGKSFPAFLFCPAGVTWKSTEELIDKLRSLKAESYLISDRSNEQIRRTAESARGQSVIIPAEIKGRNGLPDDLFTPIPYIIPAQLFAASLAEVKRLDPDRPRTLSKVTQTI
ncbi:MAG: SIS domain-containing protein [Bryobacteraceae bacterium]